MAATESCKCFFHAGQHCHRGEAVRMAHEDLRVAGCGSDAHAARGLWSNDQGDRRLVMFHLAAANVQVHGRYWYL